eukprot:TRINITY_DN5517_c0_g5_i2.p1 TRINITY_DN5517_c0_g5~~TRINITY_DN5517_c0_g5_i2.p1  ORF type:complete len:463 (-),score=35.49 TRINITY_DN5517_c0_g5_i2:313-1701(-)
MQKAHNYFTVVFINTITDSFSPQNTDLQIYFYPMSTKQHYKTKDRQNNDDRSTQRSVEEGKKERNVPVEGQKIDVEARSERFVETNCDQLFKSQNINELNCFYQGDLVHARMQIIRKSIEYIRENWSDFDQFQTSLKTFMETQSNQWPESVKKIFERRRNWVDIEKFSQEFDSLKEEFDILTFYTSKQGFEGIFKISDHIFRSDSSVDSQNDDIQNVVFLVELVNIDLFNFVHKFPQHQNFSGTVYRGMAIPADKFVIFESLMQQPINKRYISIPLGLWSSSLSQFQAISFLMHALKKDASFVPLLMKIHVLNLDKEYLQFYRRMYGNKSVVSSICAVPIADVSQHPNEQEVLLRGGFYQAINFYDEKIDDVEYKILELVMLNSNRDHLSTPTLIGRDGDEARMLFRTMVAVVRNRYIVDYCMKNNLSDDLEAYEKLLNEEQEKLDGLMKISRGGNRWCMCF